MDYDTVDWGRQEFTLSLYPHRGTFFDAGVEEAAMLLNAPLTILPEGAHDGALGMKESLLSLSGCPAVVDAVKLAQDGSGDLILHMHETARKAGTAKLALPRAGICADVAFGPGEICCLRIQPDGTVWEENLIETAERGKE